MTVVHHKQAQETHTTFVVVAALPAHNQDGQVLFVLPRRMQLYLESCASVFDCSQTPENASAQCNIVMPPRWVLQYGTARVVGLVTFRTTAPLAQKLDCTTACYTTHRQKRNHNTQIALPVECFKKLRDKCERHIHFLQS
jgi:hypothetical protein